MQQLFWTRTQRAIWGNDVARDEGDDPTRIDEQRLCMGVFEVAGQEQVSSLATVRQRKTGCGCYLCLCEDDGLSRRNIPKRATQNRATGEGFGVDRARTARWGGAVVIYARILHQQKRRIPCIGPSDPRDVDSGLGRTLSANLGDKRYCNHRQRYA